MIPLLQAESNENPNYGKSVEVWGGHGEGRLLGLDSIGMRLKEEVLYLSDIEMGTRISKLVRKGGVASYPNCPNSRMSLPKHIRTF